MFEIATETFGFPAIDRKKVSAAFDGGRLTSDGGVILLAAIERDMGMAERGGPAGLDSLAAKLSLVQGCCHAASLSMVFTAYASSGVRPASIE
jgi:hypothetical protein